MGFSCPARFLLVFERETRDDASVTGCDPDRLPNKRGKRARAGSEAVLVNHARPPLPSLLLGSFHISAAVSRRVTVYFRCSPSRTLDSRAPLRLAVEPSERETKELLSRKRSLWSRERERKRT